MLSALVVAASWLAAAPADVVRERYANQERARMVPLLREVIRFPTVAGNSEAAEHQRSWLHRVAGELGLVVRDAGKVTEVELPGPADAPVLGLVVHGDVQPVDDHWKVPPFSGELQDGFVIGRGAADDKGPLVQALLAMSALGHSNVPRTQTIRLMVGSDEESGSTDMREYLKSHAPPAYSLVLDSAFPVVIGEMAWNALYVTADIACAPRGRPKPYGIRSLEAGLAPSIVPDRATLTLEWGEGKPDWAPLLKKLPPHPRPDIHVVATEDGRTLRIEARGHASHAGVNIEGGRNALIGLAHAVEGLLPECGPSDLLAFAKLSATDIHGSGLGLKVEPGWGPPMVNAATIKPEGKTQLRLTINIRTPPGLGGEALKQWLDARVTAFNTQRGSALKSDGYYGDAPLRFDLDAKLVRRLMKSYRQATHESPPPAISGGGTYAKRLPHAIAFGMWFPGNPYPGHDVDEKIPVADLERGEQVLIEALVDLACNPPLSEPFAP